MRSLSDRRIRHIKPPRSTNPWGEPIRCKTCADTGLIALTGAPRAITGADVNSHHYRACPDCAVGEVMGREPILSSLEKGGSE